MYVMKPDTFVTLADQMWAKKTACMTAFLLVSIIVKDVYVCPCACMC